MKFEKLGQVFHYIGISRASSAPVEQIYSHVGNVFNDNKISNLSIEKACMMVESKLKYEWLQSIGVESFKPDEIILDDERDVDLYANKEVEKEPIIEEDINNNDNNNKENEPEMQMNN